MPRNSPTHSLELRSVEQGSTLEGVEHLNLQTDAGTIIGRFHPASAGDAAVIWVGGAGGGLDGPAGGMYPRLSHRLLENHVSSLRLHYRMPNHLNACVLDTLLGAAYLETRGLKRFILAGHSFGGAVVITAGAASEAVIGVAALSSQTSGTQAVRNLSPRPLLLQHGQADEVLPDACSRDLYQRAREPKQILLYPGCRHGLDECREMVDRDLLHWIKWVVTSTHRDSI